MRTRFTVALRPLAFALIVGLFIGSCAVTDNSDDSNGSNDGEFNRTLNTSAIGSYGDYTYEFWNQDETGDATMGLREDGSFEVSWNGIYNMLARNGVRPGQNVTSVTYNVDNYAVTGGISYLCVYGWFYNGDYDDLVEYYIVDNWKNYNPSSSAVYFGTVTVDGVDYNLYTSIRTQQPSINGTQTFTQYWSIRQNTKLRTSGTINVPAHFQAWEDAGLSIGSTMHEVSFCIEGFGMGNSGAGHANVTSLVFATE